MRTGGVADQERVARTLALLVRGGNEAEVHRGTGGKTTGIETLIGRGRRVEKGEGDHIRARDRDRREGQGQGLRLADREGGALRHITNETRGDELKHDSDGTSAGVPNRCRPLDKQVTFSAPYAGEGTHPLSLHLRFC